MTRNQMTNKGVPLSVQPISDLTAKKDSSFDSWYVICNFEADGQKLAFEWHQQSLKLMPLIKNITAEFLISHANENLCLHHDLTERDGKRAGASEDKLHVFSPWGSLDGDEKEMTLKLQTEEAALDVVMKPQAEVLYNGTTGLLHFGSNDSYQFSFPNMTIEGTLTLRGKTYPIENATAWFDRQWGMELSKTESVAKLPKMFQQSWLWLGMTLGDENKEAISLWDAYLKDGRHAFATFRLADGTQVNHEIDIRYDDIWQSQKSGNAYPRKMTIQVPEEDFAISIEALIDDPEFYRPKMGLSGCQVLSKVTGHYKHHTIDRDLVVELINDVCGPSY